MRVIAVLDVDEERLAKTGNDFNDRMGRLGRIGITLREYTKMDGISEYEYAAFVWNTELQGYRNAVQVKVQGICRKGLVYKAL